jgi:hypothetical protein
VPAGKEGNRGREGGNLGFVVLFVLTIILQFVELCVHSANLLLAQVHLRGGINALGHLSHYLDAITGTAEQYHVACIPWVIELLDNIPESVCALRITISQAWLLRLDKDRRRGDFLQGLLPEGVISGFSLALPPFGSVGRGRGSAGIALGCSSLVIVHPLHVVPEIPMAWEAISGDTALTAFIGTKVGFVAVSMHSVGFTLMTEKAGRGRETGVLTSNNLALVWL